MTTLRSAEKFEQSHLSSSAVAPLVNGAKVFYVEGYFLTHGLDSVVELGKKASDASKVLSLSLLLPYCYGAPNAISRSSY